MHETPISKPTVYHREKYHHLMVSFTVCTYMPHYLLFIYSFFYLAINSRKLMQNTEIYSYVQIFTKLLTHHQHQASTTNFPEVCEISQEYQSWTGNSPFGLN